MSSFLDAIKEWTQRTKDSPNDWRSSFDQRMRCLACPNVGMMLTSKDGTTKATCTACDHSWVLA